jgi:pyruvate-ferredoxin/flavodoxin oxidoreductase
MIEGFVEGLMTRRPAVFNLYSSCQPEHGIGDDMSHHQAKLAVESRAYPLLRYDPDRGPTVGDCLDLDGNPNQDLDWPVAKIEFVDEHGKEQMMELPTTFVDFAVTETRFRKHFRKIPRDSWNDDMLQVSEYLELDKDARGSKVPFVWALDAKRQLSRLLVGDPMIESAEERRAFWIMLRDLGGIEEPAADAVQIESRVRQEVAEKFASRLMGLISGSEALDMGAMLKSVSTAPAPGQQPHLKAVESVAPAADGDYMAPWIDTEECTECDECILINPSIFEYNADKKAVIKDPNGGPYRDLVKSAEKCTAEIIHPGLPRDRSEKDIDKWIKRGEKFN